MKKKLVVNWAMGLFILGMAGAADATSTTYLFDQTDNFGNIEGTLTVDEGTYYNQGIADVLNSSQYSITINSNYGRPSFTLNENNSEWSFTEYDYNDNLSMALIANNTSLQLQQTVTVENYGGYMSGELCVKSDTLGLFRFMVDVNDFFGPWPTVDFTRQGNNWHADFFLESVMEEVVEMPYTVSHTYTFPSVYESPEKLLSDLSSLIVSLNIKNGISNSLDAKLESALSALDDINENNDIAAINSLNAFINAVEAQSCNQITCEDGTVLIEKAQAVINKLESM